MSSPNRDINMNCDRAMNPITGPEWELGGGMGIAGPSSSIFNNGVQMPTGLTVGESMRKFDPSSLSFTSSPAQKVSSSSSECSSGVDPAQFLLRSSSLPHSFSFPSCNDGLGAPRNAPTLYSSLSLPASGALAIDAPAAASSSFLPEEQGSASTIPPGSLAEELLMDLDQDPALPAALPIGNSTFGSHGPKAGPVSMVDMAERKMSTSNSPETPQRVGQPANSALHPGAGVVNSEPDVQGQAGLTIHSASSAPTAPSYAFAALPVLGMEVKSVNVCESDPAVESAKSLTAEPTVTSDWRMAYTEERRSEFVFLLYQQLHRIMPGAKIEAVWEKAAAFEHHNFLTCTTPEHYKQMLSAKIVEIASVPLRPPPLVSSVSDPGLGQRRNLAAAVADSTNLGGSLQAESLLERRTSDNNSQAEYWKRLESLRHCHGEKVLQLSQQLGWVMDDDSLLAETGQSLSMLRNSLVLVINLLSECPEKNRARDSRHLQWLDSHIVERILPLYNKFCGTVASRTSSVPTSTSTSPMSQPTASKVLIDPITTSSIAMDMSEDMMVSSFLNANGADCLFDAEVPINLLVADETSLSTLLDETEEDKRCARSQTTSPTSVIGDISATVSNTTGPVASSLPPAIASSSPSTRTISAEPLSIDLPREQIIQKQRNRLLALVHVARCSVPPGGCSVFAECDKFKALLVHMTGCSSTKCGVRHCLSSRYVLAHFRRCVQHDCRVCADIRKPGLGA